MALLGGLDFQQQKSADNKPHLLSFLTARTTAHDTLFEIWNGPAVANIAAAVDLNGKYYSKAWTAGDLFYAVAGGVANVKRMDSLAIGSENALLRSTGTAPAWTSLLNVSATTVQATGIVEWDADLTAELYGHLRLYGTNTASDNSQSLRGGYLTTQFINTGGHTGLSSSAIHIIPVWGSSGSQTFSVARSLYVGAVTTGTVVLTTWYGVLIEEPSGTVSGTTFYGLKIGSVSGGATNYALHTASGLVYFGGNVVMDSSELYKSSAVGTLKVAGGNTADDGGNVLLYGGSHATEADSLSLRASNSDKLKYSGPSDNWTFAAPVITIASATGAAGLNVPPGTAPSAPTNGDVWSTAAGFFVHVNGTTYQLDMT